MQKHLLLTLLLSLIVSTRLSAYDLYYYNTADYNYAVWYWQDGQNGQWSDWMTPVAEHEHWYQTTIPDNCTNVIFVSFEKAVTVIDWDNKFKQTGDLKYTGDAYYRDGAGWRKSFDDEGSTIEWKLENYVLTISGTGPMLDYWYVEDIPWYESRMLVLSVVIEEGVTSIGSAAFANCYNLSSVQIANSVTTIGRGAFYYCLDLDTVVLPKNLSMIGSYAFQNCYNLVSINIPESVKTISEGAFYNCIHLQDLKVPSTVENIGENAFYLVQSVEYNGPASGSPWGARCLNGTCSDPILDYTYCQLELVGDAIVDQDGASVDNIWNWGNKYPMGTPKKIRDEFVWKVNHIKLNPSDAQFKIRTKNYQASGDIGAFDNGANLSVDSAGYYNVTYSINPLTKEFYHNITPSNPKANACGDNLTWKFSNTNGTLTITGSGPMYDFQEREVWFADSSGYYTEPATPWYSRASKIKKVELPDDLTYIGDLAFADCSVLTSIILPNSVTAMGKYPFSGCTAMTVIYAYPENPAFTTIDGVLYNKDVTSLLCWPGGKSGECVIPASVVKIGREAFASCSKLTAINVDENNNVYSSHEGVLYDKPKSTLLLCPQGKKGDYVLPNGVQTIVDFALSSSSLSSVVVSEGVTEIGTYAFSFSMSLKSISFPNSLTRIPDFGCYLCPQLADISFGDNLTYIGVRAFGQCDSLKTVTIPNTVKTLEEEVFYLCPNLTSVTIGSGVEGIGAFAFAYCNALQSVICLAVEPPAMGAFVYEGTSYGVFAGVDCSAIPLYVPEQSIDAYKAADQWKDFNLILPISSTGEGIDNISSSLQGGDRGRLFFYNGQIFILRGDKTYTLTGQEINR